MSSNSPSHKTMGRRANAARQAAFRARMRAQGKQRLSVWVTAQQAQAIRAFLDNAASSLQPLPTPPAMPMSPADPLALTGETSAWPVTPEARGPETLPPTLEARDPETLPLTLEAREPETLPLTPELGDTVVLPVTHEAGHAGDNVPLPLTPEPDDPEPDDPEARRARLRDALAQGHAPRFKRRVLPIHGKGWQILIDGEPVGETWRAPSGSGWKGRQTLRRSWHDALSPHRGATREQVANAILLSLDL